MPMDAARVPRARCEVFVETPRPFLSTDSLRGWFFMEMPNSKAEVHNIHEWALEQLVCSSKRNCTETQAEVLQRAQLLYWLDRPDEASKALKTLWEDNPNDHSAGVYYARLLRRDGALQQSLELLDSLPQYFVLTLWWASKYDDSYLPQLQRKIQH